jgi:diguanylate cyclase (GGDEF)-like protein
MDAASRYGFDEIIVLRENASLEAGIAFAEELRKTIEETEFTQQGIRTTVSIGAAAFPKSAISEKELLITVKETLYDAQRNGRNRVAYL